VPRARSAERAYRYPALDCHARGRPLLRDGATRRSTGYPEFSVPYARGFTGPGLSPTRNQSRTLTRPSVGRSRWGPCIGV